MPESEELASQWVTYTTVMASVRTVLDTRAGPVARDVSSFSEMSTHRQV